MGTSLIYLKELQEAKLSVAAAMKGLKIESIQSSHCGPHGGGPHLDVSLKDRNGTHTGMRNARRIELHGV